MYIKPRPIPLNVHFSQALIPRLPSNHPKIPLIERDLRSFMSGYRGEKATEYHLNFLDDKKHHIFGGLRLPHEQHHFQMDTPILSRKYILILETKNIGGELYFTEEQFSQESFYGRKGYKNPIVQVNRHKEQLQDWLESHRLPTIPLIPLVVLSNPSAIIRTDDPSILKKVCKVENLKNKLLDLTSSYTKDHLTERSLKKASRLLLEDDTPLFPEVHKSYGLSPQEIIPGIRCPKCFSYRMMRIDRVWVCPHCLYHSNETYHDAILDYFLFHKTTMTNREFRQYLGIDSVNTANKLLRLLNLPSTGSNKGRIYHRPTDFLDQLETRYHRLHKK
ncbi:NERD domain-containing protein [Mesobacillus maritimus]|uniref:nuclease-related domain-containing protein n=1 Tax=Mesobacillus maritimus TaxID=1643336 RepID=UPI002041E69E|nr:nuclease-related domain-containing protein [Mesobacillus maritimus]MCM3586898.1 NERD domain-containing protein [Mesobacillus maritimus]